MVSFFETKRVHSLIKVSPAIFRHEEGEVNSRLFYALPTITPGQQNSKNQKLILKQLSFTAFLRLMAICFFAIQN